MRYLSVCSGIEAATAAWHPLGWTPVGFSEIEKFPSAVLAHHYPDVPNFGDMSKFQEWPNDLAPNLLVGGTPCQSFSVAGLRKGLDDPRGNLMLTFGSIARRYRPEWLVWENVPGVLSSNGGRDFGTFLGMLAELGYGFAYRVLDAQYFGVAQRRRRVFVVGHLGDWRRAAAVLFERQSLSGHPAPSREPREGTSGDVGGSTGTGRWPADVASTLNAAFGDKQGLEDQHALSGASLFVPDVCGTLTARSVTSLGLPEVDGGMYVPVTAGAITASMGNGCLGHNKDENVIAHTLRGEGFDASEDGTGRGTPLVPVAFSCKDHGADAGPISPTLRSMNHDGSHANGGGQVAVAFGGQMSVPQVDFELSQTLRLKIRKRWHSNQATFPEALVHRRARASFQLLNPITGAGCQISSRM